MSFDLLFIDSVRVWFIADVCVSDELFVDLVRMWVFMLWNSGCDV